MSGVHVIVGVDVFSNVDPMHPAVSIRRGGEGKYRAICFGQQYHRNAEGKLDFDDFDSVEEALTFADGIVAYVDEEPTLMSPSAVHTAAALAAKDDRIDELEAELANTRLTLSKQVAATIAEE